MKENYMNNKYIYSVTDTLNICKTIFKPYCERRIRTINIQQCQVQVFNETKCALFLKLDNTLLKILVRDVQGEAP